MKPSLSGIDLPGSASAMEAEHAGLGIRYLYCDGGPALLFTENETNNERIFGSRNPSMYAKDAFHEHIVSGRADAVNPSRVGTKSAAHYPLDIPPGESRTIRLRLTEVSPRPSRRPKARPLPSTGSTSSSPHGFARPTPSTTRSLLLRWMLTAGG
jgi:hypothetical protein